MGRGSGAAVATRQLGQVSNISHDLRTPLSSIQGYVKTVLLRGGATDAASRATHLRTALKHVELLGKRIRDLFELSKLDVGRTELRNEVFCLAELLQDVIQTYRPAAQGRSVTLSLAADSHAHATVRADIAMIERVLQNLIDNALRHTASGGTVVLAIDDHRGLMQISVSDSGRGIESRHLPHIIERYWRAKDVEEQDSSTSSRLGLAIVKRILDLHGAPARRSGCVRPDALAAHVSGPMAGAARTRCTRAQPQPRCLARLGRQVRVGVS